MAKVYDQDVEHSENEALARTGCLVCPVAARDLALERTIRKPEWAYLSPLRQLRGVYDRLSLPHNRLRKCGERLADGRLSSNPMRLGPLTMAARRLGLSEVLAIQDVVNAAAESQGGPTVLLINAEERTRIEELMALNTWPHGWEGDEPGGGELLPETLKDGSIQRILAFS